MQCGKDSGIWVQYPGEEWTEGTGCAEMTPGSGIWLASGASLLDYAEVRRKGWAKERNIKQDGLYEVPECLGKGEEVGKM
jgi:hypothetical protein